MHYFGFWNVKLQHPAKWNAYDCEIHRAVSEFNRHLAGVAAYQPLDWHLVKAMAWVENGADKPEWKSSPIQIGNPGDPGLRALLDGKEGGDLILPPELRGRLNTGMVTTIPAYNIRAGIGYLLMRMADFALRGVPDADIKIYEIKVKAGDSLFKITHEHGSTVETLRKLNAGVHTLHPGQILRYQKAAARKVIVGWKPVTTSYIAMRYNIGDSLYAKKLDYALALICKGKATVCAQ